MMAVAFLLSRRAFRSCLDISRCLNRRVENAARKPWSQRLVAKFTKLDGLLGPKSPYRLVYLYSDTSMLYLFNTTRVVLAAAIIASPFYFSYRYQTDGRFRSTVLEWVSEVHNLAEGLALLSLFAAWAFFYVVISRCMVTRMYQHTLHKNEYVVFTHRNPFRFKPITVRTQDVAYLKDSQTLIGRTGVWRTKDNRTLYLNEDFFKTPRDMYEFAGGKDIDAQFGDEEKYR